MATNTQPLAGAQPNESTTATAAVRARLVSAAGALVTVLPALVVLGVVLLGLTNPALAFVLLGLPAAAAFGVAIVFGVARVGAAVANYRNE